MSEELEAVTTAIEGRQDKVNAIVMKLLRHEDKLSYSSLSSFWESPKDFIDYKLKQKVQTPAMVFGSMLHCLVLEPETFESKYHCIDDKDIVAQIGGGNPRNTKLYREWKEVALIEAGERILVSDKDYRDAKIMANNIKYNRASYKILANHSEREKPIEWEFENFLFKGVIDLDGEKSMADLKMVPDASHRKAQQTILRNGYYLQGAMYLTGIDAKKPYYIICVDKKGGVSVHLLEQHLIDDGVELYTKLVKQFNLCILEERFNESYDFWADRHDGIHVCEKPAYMY